MTSRNKVEIVADFRDRMSGPMKNSGKSMEQFGKDAMKAGVAVGALGAALFAATKKLAEYGASIYDTSAITGVSAERIQALGYQFEQTGGSVESFQSSLRGLTTFMRMADSETSEQGQLLAKLGLSYEELLAMKPDEIFLTLTEALSHSSSEFEMLTDAAVMFGGRYSQQVVGLINETNGDVRTAVESFEDLGIAMSQEQVNKLKAYDDAMTKIGHSMKALTADALVPFLEPMQGVIEMMVELAEDVMPTLIPVVEAVIAIFQLLLSILTSPLSGDLSAELEAVEVAVVALTAAVAINKVMLMGWAGIASTASLALTGVQVATYGTAVAVKGFVLAAGAFTAAIGVILIAGIALIKAIDGISDALDNQAAAEDRAFEMEQALFTMTIRHTAALEDGTLPALKLQAERLAALAERGFQVTDQLAEMNQEIFLQEQAAIRAALATAYLRLEQEELAGASGAVLAEIGAEIAALQRTQIALEATARDTDLVTTTTEALALVMEEMQYTGYAEWLNEASVQQLRFASSIYEAVLASGLLNDRLTAMAQGALTEISVKIAELEDASFGGFGGSAPDEAETSSYFDSIRDGWLDSKEIAEQYTQALQGAYNAQQELSAMTQTDKEAIEAKYASQIARITELEQITGDIQTAEEARHLALVEMENSLHQLQLQHAQEYLEIITSTMAGVMGVFDSFYSLKSQAIGQDKEDAVKAAETSSAKQIAAIKASAMTEQQQAEAIAKVKDKVGAQIAKINEKYEAMDIAAKEKMKPIKVAEALSNIALGVTRALASAPPPLNFIQAGLVATAGAAEVAVISAQKYGEGGLVQGSGSRDTVPAWLTPGEYVLTQSEVKSFFSNLSKGTAASIFVTYAPMYSDASPADMVKFGEAVTIAMDKRGVTLG